MKSRWADYALILLIAVGILYASLVSIRNFNGDSCPSAGPVPICYIVFIAYVFMLLSLFVQHRAAKHYLFASGWGIAFSLAVVGSAAELFSGGGVCPTSQGGNLRALGLNNGIPMCYVSLALLVAILILFLLGPYKRVCDSYNT